MNVKPSSCRVVPGDDSREWPRRGAHYRRCVVARAAGQVSRNLDAWHADAVKLDDRIQRLRRELEAALAEQERLFAESVDVDAAPLAASQIASHRKGPYRSVVRPAISTRILHPFRQ